MSEGLPVVINANNTRTSKCILPRKPLLTSHRAAWHHIGLEYHIQPAFETPKHFTTSYALIIRLNCLFGLERRLDKRYQIEDSKPGDVVIITPDVVHWAASTQESEFIALSLRPQFICDSAREYVEPDSVELLSHFSQPDPLIYHIGLSLKEALQSSPMCSKFYAESMATTLSAHVLQNYCTKRHVFKEYTGGLPTKKLQQITDYIMEHLGDSLLLGAIAKEAGMSKYHFSRLFKQSTGLSPYQYVIQCRINYAKILLSQGQLKISEVAELVGFTDQSQFTRHFKRLVGVTPKEIYQK